MDLKATTLVLTFLVLSSLYATHSMSNHKKAVSLYGANDTLLQLDFSNINSSIYGKDTAFLIEFYSSWCGHCIRFAPTWRKLVERTYQWSRVLQLGAINCASEENFPVCTNFEIKGFPTVKFFSAYATEGQKGLELKPTKEYLPKIVDYVEMHVGSSRPKHWPIFRQLDSRTKYESLPAHFADFRPKLTGEGESDAQLAVVFVFHHATSPYEPKYVTLHLSSDPRLLVFGVDVDAFRTADNRDFLKRFPDVQLLADNDEEDESSQSSIAYLALSSSVDDDAFTIASLADVDLRDAVALQKRLKELLPWTTVGLTFVPQTLPSSSIEKSSELPPPAPKGVYMSDLLKAVRYALLGEIGLRNSIEPGPDLDAVNSFVGVLTKYFPGVRPGSASGPERVFGSLAARFLRQINGWLQSRGNVTIAGREWKRRVISAANAALGDASDDFDKDKPAMDVAEPWIGCRGSRPTLRGYPCALWTLFHVLSVSAADANDGVEEDQVDGREVIDAMAKYIKSFFGCRDCASHFESMVNEDLDDSVQSYDDVILWLWKAHNKVNDRLKGTASEDPQALKIQFPDLKTCLSCRIEGNQAAWHYINVRRFLKNYYRNITIISGTMMSGGGNDDAMDAPVDPKSGMKRSSGIASVTVLVEKRRYRPGELAKIKKQREKKRGKDRKLIGDHLDVEKLRQHEKRTRKRARAPSILGFTDWSRLDVGICFGAYGFCAVVLVLLYVIYVDRRCRYRWLFVEKRRYSIGDDRKPFV